MPVRGVLFDLDDTLFDHEHATNQALAVLCLEEPALTCWPVGELRARYSALLESLHVEVLAGRMSIPDARAERFRRLLSDAGRTAIDGRPTQLATLYRAAYEGAWRAVPGAHDLLKALRARGLPIGIVTNNLVAEQRQKLDCCALGELVDVMITSEEIGATKPDPRIFHAALDRLSVSASETVMVGDVWHTDIAGALAAGIRPVWFNWRGLDSPDPSIAQVRSLTPAHRVSSQIWSPEEQ